MRRYNAEHPRPSPRERIIGIDGEGKGRRPHRYTYLAASDELGATWELSCSNSAKRLETRECLDFILNLPNRCLIFGFSFFYDLTKILQDLDDRSLYLLFHEKRRAKLVGKRVIYQPVLWPDPVRGPYSINFMNRRFSVGIVKFDDKGRKRTIARRTIWDIFAFFQSKFTKALTDWQIAGKADLERMERMKSMRSVFDQMSDEEINAYCKEECLYLAKLGNRLIEAHDEAAIPLRDFYGAGSTASALLRKLDILSYKGDFPDEMRFAVACGFFGGRFENSVIGPIAGPVYNYDISSAYPYQACLLPCLSHGSWSKCKRPSIRELASSSLALVQWTIRLIEPNQPWGALPVRAQNGTIAFPISGEGGWTWKQEFFAAKKLNPHVEATEAWIYETSCDCRPFFDLASIYRERCRIGKDAKGIVLKLGPNSVYGKLAQSRGANPKFQSWIWSGNITSGCRAQLLEAIFCAKDRRNVLMLATDGDWCKEKLVLPKPIDTGTFDLEKPLGGWEEKVFDRGVFCVRPGIYFPLDPSEDEIKQVRARGLGRRVVYDNWRFIVDAYEDGETGIELGYGCSDKRQCLYHDKGGKEKECKGVIERFVGAKTGISYGPKSGFKRSKRYGEWVENPVNVTFSPLPKRRAIMEDNSLDPWPYAEFSKPYNNAIRSPEAVLLALAELIASEQPDADFTEVQ